MRHETSDRPSDERRPTIARTPTIGSVVGFGRPARSAAGRAGCRLADRSAFGTPPNRHIGSVPTE